MKYLNKLKGLKEFTTLLSSIIIALTGIYITNEYNKKQIQITQIEGISKFLPMLTSASDKEKKMGAALLALYGKPAVPVLLSMMNDKDYKVKRFCAESIAMIGSEIIPTLIDIIKDYSKSDALRSGAIYTIGRMKIKNLTQVIRPILLDPIETPLVKQESIYAIGMARDLNGALLIINQVMPDITKQTERLIGPIAWTLAKVGPRVPSEFKDTFIDKLIYLLSQTNGLYKQYIINSLLSFDNERATSAALQSNGNHVNGNEDVNCQVPVKPLKIKLETTYGDDNYQIIDIQTGSIK